MLLELGDWPRGFFVKPREHLDGRYHTKNKSGARALARENMPFMSEARRWWFLLGTALTIVLVYALRGILLSLVFAFLLAYALDPFVDVLAKRRVPRPLGSAFVMLALLTTTSLLVAYAVPMFVDELREVTRDLPTKLGDLQKRAEPWLLQYAKWRPPHSVSEWTKTLNDRLQGQSTSLLSTVSSAVFGTLGYVAGALSLLIVPVFALYLLVDLHAILRRARSLIPTRWQDGIVGLFNEIHTTLGSYVRGQITANFVLAALYAVGLQIVDIRLAAPIGILTGMLAFVPYVGFSLGLFLALAMAILDWHGPGRVFGVLGVMLGVQLLDGLVITPRIVGRSVGLSPLEVLLALAAGGTLFGFVGVLFAVPLGAITKIVIRRTVQAYQASEFYNRARALSTTPPPQTPPNPPGALP